MPDEFCVCELIKQDEISMKKEFKAALLCAVVYPGAGQFFLNKRLIGVIFAGLFSVFLIFTFQDIFAIAQCTANEIVSGKIAISATAILNAASNPSSECTELAEYKYVSVMIIIWVFSVIDAFRLGKK